MTRHPRSSESISMTRPVNETGPRRRCSIGAWRSQVVSPIRAKPAQNKVSANVASHGNGRRCSATVSPPAAIVAPRPSHSGGSTVSAK